MSVEALSGKDGTAKKNGSELTTDVTAWQFEPSVGTAKYASQNTGGHKVTVDTVEDFSGSITTKLDKDGVMPFRVRDKVTLQLHVNDSGNDYVTVPALIVSHPIPCDIDNGEPIEVQYNFEPRGAPTYHGILASADNSSSGA